MTPARRWQSGTGQERAAERVGIPWSSLTAVLRIATNPRALAEPPT